jgi:hypothetical protein
MKRQLTIILLAAVLLSLAVGSSAEAGRKTRPWPEISLSTVPSIVWMANSWAYEINHRSPTYLGDLDKMYISFAFGYGRNRNSLDNLIAHPLAVMDIHSTALSTTELRFGLTYSTWQTRMVRFGCL